MGQTRINPRLLMVAAVGALIVALVSLAISSLAVSAMGWLAFEILAILSAILISTPGGATSRASVNVVAPLATHTPIAKIYDSATEPVVRDDAA